ncbi:hypothetical protein GGF37_002222 [Kickxella alabastrina]|nr:hypothetical protein GGF37_002222 [Kickxella alabastrina]
MATPEAPLREILKSISFTQFPLYHQASFFTPTAITRAQLHICRHTSSSTNTTNSGSPTLDIQSLRTLALLRFANYPVDLHCTSDPESSPDRHLPFLLLPDGSAIGASKVAEHLGVQCVGEDLAYLLMVERNLVPAIEYLLWVDPSGYETVSREGFLGRYPGLIGYLLGWQRSAAVARELGVAQGFGAGVDGEAVYEGAFRALDSILGRLGSKEYLAQKNGEEEVVPGALDALVFACLNVFLEAPLASPVRSAMTRQGSQYRPLVDYTMRILERHLA